MYEEKVEEEFFDGIKKCNSRIIFTILLGIIILDKLMFP